MGMTGPDLDLAALREAIAEFRLCPDDLDDELALVRVWALRAVDRETRAVLSLVDDLRAENERLRKALTMLRREHVLFPGATDPIAQDIVRQVDEVLAGSPAANEEQQ